MHAAQKPKSRLNFVLLDKEINMSTLWQREEECKRSTDRDEGLLEMKEADANEQHKGIIGALKVAVPNWEFEQINFVVGNRGLVVFSSKNLMYKKEKKTSSSPIMCHSYAKRTIG